MEKHIISQNAEVNSLDARINRLLIKRTDMHERNVHAKLRRERGINAK